MPEVGEEYSRLIWFAAVLSFLRAIIRYKHPFEEMTEKVIMQNNRKQILRKVARLGRGLSKLARVSRLVN